MSEVSIALDRKHRAVRSADRWAVQQLQPSGDWDLVAAWEGTRRSLLAWCAEHDVTPSRQAEEQLSRLPESRGFRERT